MGWSFLFFFNSVLLGFGLAMDAFSTSVANGLAEPGMKKGKMFGISGVYALFQFLMPLIGWFCVHSIAEHFEAFRKYIPWIGFILLIFIGGKMVIDGIRYKDEPVERVLGLHVLLVQGIATSIDALSVGFTITDYNLVMAIVASLIIGLVTYFICYGGLIIGRKIGSKISGKAQIVGGIVLICVGIEILLKGLLA